MLVGLIYRQNDAILTQYAFSGIAWDVLDAVSPPLPGEVQGVRAGLSMLPVHDTSDVADSIASGVSSSASSNLLTTVTSSDGAVTYVYDAENRWIAETIDTDGDGQIDQTIGFVYDGDQIGRKKCPSFVPMDLSLLAPSPFQTQYCVAGLGGIRQYQ